MRDAEVNAEEDKKKKELVDARNQAEQLVYATRKSLKDFGDKVDGAARGDIENATRDLEEALKGDDIDLIKSRTEKLRRRPTSCPKPRIRRPRPSRVAVATAAQMVRVRAPGLLRTKWLKKPTSKS